MFELTINGAVYSFKFGMGFMRELNKLVRKPVDGLNIEQNMGLQYYVAGVIDGDLETLVDVLFIANKTENPRVTKALLDAYIEAEDTDIDKLFEDVLDFLRNANATKKTTLSLLKEVEKAKQAAKA